MYSAKKSAQIGKNVSGQKKNLYAVELKLEGSL